MPALRLPRLPNRWRITLWIVAAVVVVTFVVGLVIVALVRDRFTARIDDELRSQGAGLAAALEVIDQQQLVDVAEREPSIADATYGVVLVGADGTVVSVPSGPPDDPDPPLDVSARAIGALRSQAGDPFDVASADGSTTYRAVVEPRADGGLVVVTRSLDDRDDAVRTVIGVLVLTGAIASLVLTLVVAVVSSLVTRPLDAMIDTAEAIGEGDLTSRVPTRGVEDVSRLATALNQMLDRIEAAFADKQTSEDALRRFVADASHELRTPLASVLGYAELHESGMATAPADVERAMARIRAEGERMRLIVDELLTLARLDEGRPMERSEVDLVDLVRVAAGDARAVDPGRPLHLDLPDGRVAVPGDAPSLRQAIDNLLVNARTHTPDGTPVHVTVAREGDGAVVRVRDEGPGMSEADAVHVFDRFYRADASRRRPGGSGLGLAIVAAIAHAHDGTATVETAPGAGTTFALHLPAPAAP